MSYTAASLVFIAAGAGGLPGLLLTAAADRWSRRVIAAGGAALFSLAFALFAWAPNGATAVAAMALAGFGATGMVDGVEVALSDVTSGDRLRVWLARQNVGAVIGDLAGPALLAVVLFAGLGWRAAFAVAAVAIGAYAVLLAVTPLPPPRAAGAADPAADADAADADGDDADEHGDDEDDDTDVATVIGVLRDPRVWIVGLFALGTVPFDEPFLGFLVAHLGQTRGAPPGMATIIAALAVAGGLLTHGIAARRPLRASDRTLFVVGAGALLAGSTVVAVVPAVAAIAVGALAVDVGINVCWLAVQHRTLTLRPGQAGRTKAAVAAIESAGFAVPLLIGSVADALTLTTAMLGFALLAAILLAVAAGARRTLG